VSSCAYCGAGITTPYCTSCGRPAVQPDAPTIAQAATTVPAPTVTSASDAALLVSGADRPKFHYGWSYLRWLLWLLAFGTAFGIGEGCWLALSGKPTEGLVIFVSNFVGYLLIAPFAALVFALFGWFRQRPVRLATGFLIVLGSGIAVGFAAGVQTFPRASTPNLSELAAAVSPGVASASPSDTSPKGLCYAAYAAKRYDDVKSSCLVYVATLVPRLLRLRSSNDYRATADTSAEMFEVAYMTVEAYRAQGNDAMARRQAENDVGWGIIYLGAVDYTDASFAMSHSATTQRIKARLALLEREFPGVIETERQKFLKLGM
jgi:hypothetical protein